MSDMGSDSDGGGGGIGGQKYNSPGMDGCVGDFEASLMGVNAPGSDGLNNGGGGRSSRGDGGCMGGTASGGSGTGSNGGTGGGCGNGGGGQVEQELATKMLQIQSKRFYLDVKQNRRGRFIKVAEIGADGRRSQIFLALSTAAEFRDHLSAFSDYYASLGPPNPDNVPDDGKLKSEMMIKDNRRYYLDLKENARGRFLRVSQTITRGGPRSQIAVPAQGMIEFRDALTDLLEEFGTNDGGFKGELPEGRHMKVENKNFYFDIGQNNRGIYMRVSEVKSNFRTAITVPEKCWSRFRDILTDYCDKMKSHGPVGANSNSNTGNNNGSATTMTTTTTSSASALINQGLADALLGVDIGGLLGNGGGGGGGGSNSGGGVIGQQAAVGTPSSVVGPIGSGMVSGGVLGDRGDGMLQATAGGSGPHGGLK